MVIKEKQYKQLCPLHYYSWFLMFRLSFHQSLALILAANTFLKESAFPSPSMPGLHICCQHRTDALLWIMSSLLPCLSPFFWPHSGAWFPPFSREDLFLPTTFPSISLSIQIDLRVSAPCSVVGWRCALRRRYVNYDFSKAGLSQTIFKGLFVEAKCSFWIIHSMVITLRKGLIAFSVLPCYNELGGDPSDPFCWTTLLSLVLRYQRVTWLGYPRKIPKGVPTVGKQDKVRREEPATLQ